MVEPLAALLDDNDDEVRMAALVSYKDTRALEPLAGLLDDVQGG